LKKTSIKSSNNFQVFSINNLFKSTHQPKSAAPLRADNQQLC